jgi:DNA-directed RNA polymerase specialized sigma24 family protein
MNKEDDVKLTELFLRAARGDLQAAEEFWRSEVWAQQVQDDCEFICWRYPLPNSDWKNDAQDLRQRACLRMVEKCSLFKGRASVRTWFMCIAMRLQFKEFAKRQKEREYLRNHACEVKRDLSDKVPGVRMAVLEAWSHLSERQQELYAIYLQCADVTEVVQALMGSEWLMMTDEEQLKERYKVARELKQVQKVLMEAAELKWLTALGQQNQGTNDAR